MRFKNKVVIVTGGAKGIGRATAVLFAKEGARVVIADCDAVHGRRTARAIENQNGYVIFVKTDVSDSAEVRHMVDTALKNCQRVDILFNNAGIYTRGDIVATPPETWDRIVQINLTSVYLCSRTVIPIMKAAGGGVIINTSSSVGLHATAPGIAAYAASKGGVTFLTKAMADDHLAYNIRVNCICPGPTDTPLLRKSRTKEQLKLFVQSLPCRRLLRPDEIAKIVLFLASDEASSITGAAFPIDKGQTAHL